MSDRMVANTTGDFAGPEPEPEAVEPDPANVPVQPPAAQNDKHHSFRMDWPVTVVLGLLHLGAIYGIFLLPSARDYSIMWGLFVHTIAGFGVTAGAHRLWSHRSYKARLPLRMFLAIAQSITFQDHIFKWVRRHRVHHKYSDTDADPHNAKRGFFFSHIGWVLVQKHPDVIPKLEQVDMSDVLNDPVVKLQMKFYLPSALLLCFAVPTLVPLLWGEDVSHAFFICAALRQVFTLHCTYAVNSVAHLWGDRPYDKNINPAQNVLVSLFAQGEGWHNYHHVFPYDYSTSEFGWKVNLTTVFIDFMARIGQAYDLKKASPSIVRARAARTGDGCRKEHAQ